MKNVHFKFLAILFCFGLFVGCSDSKPQVIEQTMTQEEIDAADAEYEAEMEAAENDTMGEG
jgi:hypothetical protein